MYWNQNIIIWNVRNASLLECISIFKRDGDRFNSRAKILSLRKLYLKYRYKLKDRKLCSWKMINWDEKSICSLILFYLHRDTTHNYHRKNRAISARFVMKSSSLETLQCPPPFEWNGVWCPHLGGEITKLQKHPCPDQLSIILGFNSNRKYWIAYRSTTFKSIIW